MKTQLPIKSVLTFLIHYPEQELKEKIFSLIGSQDNSKIKTFWGKDLKKPGTLQEECSSYFMFENPLAFHIRQSESLAWRNFAPQLGHIKNHTLRPIMFSSSYPLKNFPDIAIKSIRENGKIIPYQKTSDSKILETLKQLFQKNQWTANSMVFHFLENKIDNSKNNLFRCSQILQSIFAPGMQIDIENIKHIISMEANPIIFDWIDLFFKRKPAEKIIRMFRDLIVAQSTSVMFPLLSLIYIRTKTMLQTNPDLPTTSFNPVIQPFLKKKCVHNHQFWTEDELLHLLCDIAKLDRALKSSETKIVTKETLFETFWLKWISCN